MAGAYSVKTTYKPEFAETLTTAQASVPYGFSWKQRALAWLIPFLIFIPVGIFAAALVFILPEFLSPLVGKFIAISFGIMTAFASTFFLMKVYNTKIAPRINARWITLRSRPLPLVTFTANSQELRWESENSGIWLHWSEVERMFITPQTIGFLIGAMAYNVPNRAFADDAAIAAFVLFAMEHLPEPTRTLSSNDPKISTFLTQHSVD